MIQHEALPLDPNHTEIFEVPEELQLGVSAYIKLFHGNQYIGEASSLEKIPHVAHAWVLSKVVLFDEVSFKEEITIETTLLTAEKLCYLSDEGWVIMSFRERPLQKTRYIGHFSQDAWLRDVSSNNVRMYEHIGFIARGKGEIL
jgi:hypothetical protein